MVKPALIALLVLAGCATEPKTVFVDRPVPVLVPTPVPCVDAADRRPPPTALADEAIPETAKQLVAAMGAKIRELLDWVSLADGQLNACTKE